MLPTQRTAPATRNALTAAVLSRSASPGAEADTSAAGTGTASVSGGGALLISLDASSRENLLGRPDTSRQAAADETTTNTAQTPASADRSAVGSANPTLDEAVRGLQQNLHSLARDSEAFHAALSTSFGDAYDKAAAENIRLQTVAGDFSWMPGIRVVAASTLADQSGTQANGVGMGAYSVETNTIYINADVLSDNPEQAVSVLTEEVGHALDALLNTHDAAGDEGDIFARVVSGEPISDTDLAALRTEDDSGTIIIDGREIEVEYLFGIGSSIKKAFKSIGNTIQGAVDSVSGAVTKTIDSVVDTLKEVGRSIEKSVSKVLDSPVFNAIMAIAQYIPIPVVAAVVTIYNAARAGYQVFQGVRHGSLGAVLGGVAGLAGGTAKIGGALGVPQKFIDGATRVSEVAGRAGQVYRATAAKDFTAALSIASNLFEGTSAGTILGTARQVSGVRDAVRSGDVAGALSQATVLTNSLDGGQQAGSLLGDITGHAQVIDGLVSLVRDGHHTAAAAGFLSRYGDQVGIDGSARENVLSVAQALESAGDLSDAAGSGDYSRVLRSIAATSGLPADDDTLAMLGTSLDLQAAVREQDVGKAARSAAALADQSGRPELAARFEQLAERLGSNTRADSTYRTPPYVPELTGQRT